ncbi:EAL domain-containing protein [Marinibactrum halimedae]|uniref:EAL domain-containing protein n=1 Tax=Marinibactrum halimedae TaxID=1444977 RepID=A0AA37T7Z2_9GAMM|nr:EAL domain-containing protein [Marinibactrum halimedae]MCD9457716.1 EAL domain-containing protein [Marinibactrum halimedae]GLS24910.1 hypothetical protein GCM10007877_06240 [Marinibactrum halimedae]
MDAMPNTNILNNKRFLVVDTNRDCGKKIGAIIQKFGGELSATANDDEDAVRQIHYNALDMVLIDVELNSDERGIRVAKVISKCTNIPIVFMAKQDEHRENEREKIAAPYGIIFKPISEKDFLFTVDIAFLRHAIEQKSRQTEYQLQKLIDTIKTPGPTNTNFFKFHGIESFIEKKGESTQITPNTFYQLCSQPEHTLRKKLDQSIPFDCTIAPFKNQPGRHVLLKGIQKRHGTIYINAVVDIQSKGTEFSENTLLHGILNIASDGIVITDKQGTITCTNNVFSNLLGYPANALIGQPLAATLTHQRASDISFSELLQSTSSCRKEVTLQNSSGNHFCCTYSFSELDKKNDDYYYAAIFTDISSLKEAHRQLHYLAYTDPLTGVMNRHGLTQFLDQNSHQEITVIFIDVNKFKLINDRYGHHVGDEVLIEIAQRVSQNIREKDYLYRIGGDEFVIVVNNPNHTKTLVDKLTALFDLEFETSATRLTVTASIGIATSDRLSSTQDLLKHADTAMYHAKSYQQENICFYNDDLRSDISIRQYLEESIRRGLVDKEFTTYLQPIVDDEEHVIGIEALCRWRGNGEEIIAPDRFIPVAEEAHLIDAIGQHVFREACIARSILEAKGYKDLPVHINVSPEQLHKPDFFKFCKDTIDDIEIESNQVVLEVREAAILHHDCRKQLARFILAGFKIAIDDFGAGYTQLQSIKSFDYHIVKIDRSLLPKSGRDIRGQILLQHTLGLCKALGMKVIVEGIETPAQVQLMRQLNFDGLQGFYYAKPMHLIDLLKYMDVPAMPTGLVNTISAHH